MNMDKVRPPENSLLIVAFYFRSHDIWGLLVFGREFDLKIQGSSLFPSLFLFSFGLCFRLEIKVLELSIRSMRQIYDGECFRFSWVWHEQMNSVLKFTKSSEGIEGTIVWCIFFESNVWILTRGAPTFGHVPPQISHLYILNIYYK